MWHNRNESSCLLQLLLKKSLIKFVSLPFFKEMREQAYLVAGVPEAFQGKGANLVKGAPGLG